MVRHLGSSLTDVTYVFDEPTIGLHAHDVQQMNDLLQRLRDKGNTVLVVEHEPDVIRIADHVVDMGPRAGAHGGEIVYEGPFDGLGASGTLTGQHLDVHQELKAAVREADRLDPHPQRPPAQPAGRLGRRAARRARRGHRRGRLRQELADPRLPAPDDPSVTVIDQSAIRGSRRSNPATYTGILDPIRKAFAIGQRRQAGAVQRQLRGRVPGVQGPRPDLHRPGVHGRRRLASARRARAVASPTRSSATSSAAGTSARSCAMSVEEAQAFFTEKPVRVMLDRLADVGLGYVSLGQMLNTLSGGERQRLKLAIEMSGGRRGLRPRRADLGPPHARRRQPHRPARPARRGRTDGDRHRAQPRRRRARRLGHRPRARAPATTAARSSSRDRRRSWSRPRTR